LTGILLNPVTLTYISPFSSGEDFSHYIQDGEITFTASPAENLILIVE
jgi:hypothetical protein